MEEAGKIANFFNSETFKIFLSSDKKGVELAGALKNIYAISAGLSDGIRRQIKYKSHAFNKKLV